MRRLPAIQHLRRHLAWEESTAAKRAATPGAGQRAGRVFIHVRQRSIASGCTRKGTGVGACHSIIHCLCVRRRRARAAAASPVSRSLARRAHGAVLEAYVFVWKKPSSILNNILRVRRTARGGVEPHRCGRLAGPVGELRLQERGTAQDLDRLDRGSPPLPPFSSTISQLDRGDNPGRLPCERPPAPAIYTYS